MEYPKSEYNYLHLRFSQDIFELFLKRLDLYLNFRLN